MENVGNACAIGVVLRNERQSVQCGHDRATAGRLVAAISTVRLVRLTEQLVLGTRPRNVAAKAVQSLTSLRRTSTQTITHTVDGDNDVHYRRRVARGARCSRPKVGGSEHEAGFLLHVLRLAKYRSRIPAFGGVANFTTLIATVNTAN